MRIRALSLCPTLYLRDTLVTNRATEERQQKKNGYRTVQILQKASRQAETRLQYLNT